MPPLSQKETLALRRAITDRLNQAEKSQIRQGWLQTWLETVPDDQLVDQARIVRAALSDERTWSESVFTLYHLVRNAPAAVSVAVREALMRRVAAKQLTDGKMMAIVREIGEADEATRDRLVAELLTPLEKPSLAGVHTLLVHAVRAAPAEALPAGPLHRGEPAPSIGAQGYTPLALFLARRYFEDELTPEQREIYDGLVREARAILEGGTSAGKTHDPERGWPPALRLAAAAGKDARLSYSRPDSVGTSTRSAITQAVKQLDERGELDRLRVFLQALDDELRRLDVEDALRKKKKEPSSPVACALWRAGEGKKVLFWLARLEDGRYGLLSKIGRRWAWTEGDRDHVLATVPDDRFEAAVMAAADDAGD